MTQEQKERRPAKHDVREVETEEFPAQRDEETSELLDELDALLDAIDDVLEENAEQFVTDYVQMGGQ